MSINISSSLLDKIKSELMSNNPDVTSIESLINCEYDLDSKDAKLLCYHLVRELNLNLFPAIRKLELLLTRSCNLKCDYCFEQPIKGSEKMSEETALKAIDLLVDYSANSEELHITHFGGEPTLNFPVLKKVTEYVTQKATEKGKKVNFNMTSNGVFFTDEMIDFFAEYNIKVLLSIDGLKSSHDKFRIDHHGLGSFDRAIDSMKRLKKKMPWIGVKITTTKENIPNLLSDIIGLYELGVNQFILGPATNSEWNDSDVNSYLEQIDKIYRWYQRDDIKNIKISEFEEEQDSSNYFGCRAARDSIVVDVDGSISGCSKILSLEGDRVIGKLGDINYGLTHIKERLDYISCDKLKDNCKAVGIYDDYQGGCFASNYEANGDVFKPNLFEHKFSMKMQTRLRDLMHMKQELC